jgi:hypothetical protein
MENTLLVIDSYLSNQERADSCINLIHQLKELMPNHKILVINKYKESWDLDKLVDYYYFHGSGFLLGLPPQHLLDSNVYERPYTYVDTQIGTCENWFPLVNVSDHAADVYNSFILSSRIGKALGYEKIFKVEYDTIFDKDEFNLIKKDIENFQDYLFYGARSEGKWAKPNQYLIDVHIIGYSTSCFDGYDIVRNDDDYWKLCGRVGYHGKWVEYLIPAVIDEKRKTSELIGTKYHTQVRKMFSKSKFDVISSPGEWGDAWNVNPKICKVGYLNPDMAFAPNEMILFFWGNDKEAPIRCIAEIVNSQGETTYHKDITMNTNMWYFDKFRIEEAVTVKIKSIHKDFEVNVEKVVKPEDLEKYGSIAPRFLYK